MSAPRKADPIPKATTSAVFALRAGDERQDRHELGVDGQQRHRRAGRPTAPASKLIWPAWTDAISSSVESKSVPPADAMQASFGWTTDARAERPTRRSRPPTTVPTAAIQRPAGRGDRAEAEHDRRARVDQREHGDEDRRPDARDQDERDDQAADDRADRVRREQTARLRPACGGLVRAAAPTPPGRRSRARSSPAGRPGAIEPTVPRASRTGCPGSSVRRDRGRTRARRGERRDQDLGDARGAGPGRRSAAGGR